MSITLKVPVIGGAPPKRDGAIHVCYATDGNGTQPRQLLCSLYTLRMSGPDPEKVFVHILCGEGGERSLSDSLRRELDGFFSKAGLSGFEYLDAYTPTRGLFPGLEGTYRLGHISFPTWYRFAIPDLVPAEYTLYLDTDTFVRGDLSSFFSCGINTCAFMCSEDVFAYGTLDRQAKAGIRADSFENGPPLQAGVLVLNRREFISRGVLDRVKSAVASDQSSGHATSDQRALEISRQPGDCCVLPKYMVFPLASIALRVGQAEPLDIFTAKIWHYHGPKEQRYFENPKLRGPFDIVYRNALEFIGEA